MNDSFRWAACACALAIAGCNASEAKPDAPPDPKPSAAPATAGELLVHYEFLEMPKTQLKLAKAFAYVKEGELTIELVSEGVGDVKCNHSWQAGHEVPVGKLVLVLDEVSFEGKPGKQTDFGYTYYWHAKADPKGTNSGNSGKEGLGTVLDITKVDDKVIAGKVKIRDEAEGSFTAEICK